MTNTNEAVLREARKVINDIALWWHGDKLEVVSGDPKQFDELMEGAEMFLIESGRALAATATVAKEGELSKIDLDHQIKEAWTKDGRSGPTPWTFVREVTRILATPKAEASAEQPAGEVLTDAQIAKEAEKYSIFACAGQYDITRYECEEDFYNCVRACVALAAPISEDTGKADSSSAAPSDATYMDAPGIEDDCITIPRSSYKAMLEALRRIEENDSADQSSCKTAKQALRCVPYEATEAMLHAAEDVPAPRPYGAVYRAMLEAAPSPTGESLSARKATDWLEFVRRAKLIYNEGDEGMQALDYLLALVDTSITAADLAAASPTVPGEPT